MPGVHIKKDDTVIVMAGKDRGKTGRVLHVQPKEGGIIDTELFIDISNVQLVCGSCGQPTRVGHRIDGDAKVRICRKCEAEL